MFVCMVSNVFLYAELYEFVYTERNVSVYT